MSEPSNREEGKGEGVGEAQTSPADPEVLRSEEEPQTTKEEIAQMEERDAAQISELREKLGLEENDVEELRNELKDVFDPNFTILGHGTKLEVAGDILQSGIRTTESKGSWDMVGVPLDSSTESLKNILHWPHKEANAIVMIMIPNRPDSLEVGLSDYLNAVFEEDETQGYKLLRIPPKYLKGYVNVQTKKFVENPLFSPEIPSVAAKGIASIGKRELEGEIPIPSAGEEGESEKKDENVW